MRLGEVQSCDGRTGVTAKCLRTSWFPCLFSRTIFAVYRKETWYKRHVAALPMPTDATTTAAGNCSTTMDIWDPKHQASRRPQVSTLVVSCSLPLHLTFHCLLARQPPRYKVQKPRPNVARKAACAALTEKPVGISGRIQK